MRGCRIIIIGITDKEDVLHIPSVALIQGWLLTTVPLDTGSFGIVEKMHGKRLGENVLSLQNPPPGWLESYGNRCSPWPELAWDFCDLSLYSLKPGPSFCQNFPSIQSWMFAFPPDKWLFFARARDNHWCLRREPLLPPASWACGTSGPFQLQQYLLRPSGHLCQRPFVTGLEKNNKAALPSSPLRDMKTRVGTHRLFVPSGTQCQLPSLAGRAKWQNTMKCSIGVCWVSQDRGCILFKESNIVPPAKVR